MVKSILTCLNHFLYPFQHYCAYKNVFYISLNSPSTHSDRIIIKFQDTDNCLSASLVAQKIALKTKIFIHITPHVFRFNMT